MQHRAVFLALVATAALMPPVARAVPQYRAEVVDSRGGTSATDLNNRGEVIGYRYNYSQRGTSTYVFRNGRLRLLDIPGLDVHGGIGINDHGAVTGWGGSSTPGDPGYAFLYRNGQLGDISGALGPNTAGETGTRGMAVNNLGQAAGIANYQPFYFDGQASHALLRQGQRFEGEVADINTQGVVVGYERVPGPVTSSAAAFVARDGVATWLPTLGGTDSIAHGINDRGQIVGTSTLVPGSATFAPFLYSNGQITNLGSLSTLQGGSANDINERGWVVGHSRENSGLDAGFLYRNGTMLNLNGLLRAEDAALWNVVEATKLNDRGQILAIAESLDDPRRMFSLLLSPVPEAQTWALMLAGLGVVGAVARRRRTAH